MLNKMGLMVKISVYRCTRWGAHVVLKPSKEFSFSFCMSFAYLPISHMCVKIINKFVKININKFTIGRMYFSSCNLRITDKSDQRQFFPVRQLAP